MLNSWRSSKIRTLRVANTRSEQECSYFGGKYIETTFQKIDPRTGMQSDTSSTGRCQMQPMTEKDITIVQDGLCGGKMTVMLDFVVIS